MKAFGGKIGNDVVAAYGVPKVVTATTQLEPNDRLVIATVPASGSITITVPPAAMCWGDYIVYIQTDLGGTSVIVKDSDGNTHATLTAAGDYTVLKSFGIKWVEMKSVET